MYCCLAKNWGKRFLHAFPILCFSFHFNSPKLIRLLSNFQEPFFLAKALLCRHFTLLSLFFISPFNILAILIGMTCFVVTQLSGHTSFEFQIYGYLPIQRVFEFIILISTGCTFSQWFPNIHESYCVRGRAAFHKVLLGKR